MSPLLSALKSAETSEVTGAPSSSKVDLTVKASLPLLIAVWMAGCWVLVSVPATMRLLGDVLLPRGAATIIEDP